jgi:hypothetical protein
MVESRGCPETENAKRLSPGFATDIFAPAAVCAGKLCLPMQFQKRRAECGDSLVSLPSPVKLSIDCDPATFCVCVDSLPASVHRLVELASAGVGLGNIVPIDLKLAGLRLGIKFKPCSGR